MLAYKRQLGSCIKQRTAAHVFGRTVETNPGKTCHHTRYDVSSKEGTNNRYQPILKPYSSQLVDSQRARALLFSTDSPSGLSWKWRQGAFSLPPIYQEVVSNKESHEACWTASQNLAAQKHPMRKLSSKYAHQETEQSAGLVLSQKMIGVLLSGVNNSLP